jgi:hypothetical protein
LFFAAGAVLANAEMLAAIVIALVVASWLAFHPGADRIWSACIRRTDIDW